MSDKERKMKKIGGDYEKKPIVAQFIFKKADPAYPLDRQIKKGDTFSGEYLCTFTNTNGGFVYKKHLLDTKEHGLVTLAGCQFTNQLEGKPRGTYLEIKFDGVGKPKPGKKPPYLFSGQIEDNGEAPVVAKKGSGKLKDITEPDETEVDAEEELDEEIPF